ncbi:MAG TPA: DUF885 family protein, partial [Polyangiaceae bacterium]
MLHPRIFGPATLALALLPSCARPAPPKAAPPDAPKPAPNDATFARSVDEFFDAEFAFNPSSATSTGFHDRDRVLEDRSAAHLTARVAELKGFRDRFAALDLSRLGPDDAIDAEALKNQTNAELLDMETRALWQTNPMMYASLPGEAVHVLMKRDFAPAAERLGAVVERLRGVPAIYAAARENLRNPP